MKQVSINNAINRRGHAEAEALGLRFCTKCRKNKPNDLFDFPRGGNSATAWCTECRANKKCPKCERVLPRDSHFPKLNTGKKRIKAYCLECNSAYQRAWKLDSEYQLTQDRYESMLKEQGGVCLICYSSNKLVIDHDHSTGKVRGILCDHCNRGLGYFRDNPESLLTAANYLETRSSL